MIDLLPEPKVVHEDGNKTKKFKNLWLKSEQGISEELIALSRERFWNYQEVKTNESLLFSNTCFKVVIPFKKPTLFS